jgi:hypothetical protein
MIVSKRLPKKKDLAEHTVDEYKVADLIDAHKKSTMKRWCKEECEAVASMTVEVVEAARKVSSCLLENIGEKNAYLMTE